MRRDNAMETKQDQAHHLSYVDDRKPAIRLLLGDLGRGTAGAPIMQFGPVGAIGAGIRFARSARQTKQHGPVRGQE